MKIVIDLRNINKLTSLIGEEWVKDKFNNYRNEDPKVIHPYISFLFHIKTYKETRKTTPGNIFYDIYLKDYQILDVFTQNLLKYLKYFPNKFKFIKELKNPEQFWNNVFEISSFDTLYRNSYNPRKIPEGKKKTPDFICSKNDFTFTVECTNLNEPGEVRVQRMASQYFISKFNSIVQKHKYNFRLRIVTSESIKNNARNLFMLTKEVIDNECIGFNFYNDNKINIYFEKTKFKRGEYHLLNSYVNKYPMITAIENNCLSMFFRMTNKENTLVSNLNEIGIHYDFDINKKIINSVFNKIDYGQEFNGLPKCIFCRVTNNNNSDYNLDIELIKNKIREKIKNNNSIHSVYIFKEEYSNIPEEGGWGTRIKPYYIKTNNENAIGFNHNMYLAGYTSGTIPKKYSELSKDEKDKVYNDLRINNINKTQ